MKLSLILLSVLFFACTANAQFFKPLAKPGHAVEGRFALAADSVMNSIRPIVDVTASVSNGTQLAGGLGIGLEHLKWDVTSQSWVTVYSVSAIGFLGTNGTKITGTGGLIFGIPGTNGLIAVGPGYDFTNKQIVLLTGVQIQFK